MLRPTFAILLTFTSFCHADEVRWINPAGGSFSNPANWDTGQVPATTDSAIFDMAGTYTVTLAANQKVGDIVTSAGAITLDLGGHTLTSNITSSAGMLWVTSGSVSGSARAAGGHLVVESSATFDRGGSASDAGTLIVRGHVGKAGDGFGGFTVASGAQMRLEGGSIGTRSFSVFGSAEVIGGSIHAETTNISGEFNMNGGTLDGEFGQDFWQGSTSRMYNGAVVRCSDTGAALDGVVTIEGEGTRVRTSRVAGTVTVRDGGAVHRDEGEFKISGDGRLVLGRGGAAEGRFYRMDNGVLRLEAGAEPVEGFEGFGMFPNVGLEIVIDGGESPSFRGHAFHSFFTELSGSLLIQVINPNGLGMDEEFPLLTAAEAPISGSFGVITVPSMPGGRTLEVEVESARVVARVVAGGGHPCWSSDFNGDGEESTDGDIEAFFECLAGRCCPTCGSADFNSDGDVADSDIEAFFRVLAGNPC